MPLGLQRASCVPTDALRAVLDGRRSDLPPELADVYDFTKAVVAATWDEEVVRERIRRRYGEEGLVELALAIASARFFPITKRALGYAARCGRVQAQV